MTEHLRRALRELPDPSRQVSPDFAERVMAAAHRRRRVMRAGSAGLVAAAVAAIVAAGVTLTGTSSAARIMPVTPPATSAPATPPAPSPSASATGVLVKPSVRPSNAPLAAPIPTLSVTGAPPTSPATAVVASPPTASTTPPPVASTSTPATPTCLTAQLVLSIQYLQGAGGDEYDVLSMGNVSNITCTLTGYPVVVLTDPQGKTLTLGDADRGKPVATITVPPGGFASTFLLAFPNACTTAAGPQYSYAKGVTVTPPGNSAAAAVPASGIPLCQNVVEPMQSGAQPAPG